MCSVHSNTRCGKGVAVVDTPKVSVLVPIYNVERFLAQCLDRLLAQTLDDIEIICIDDGSTDASPQILASYASCDERIHVLTKSNTGYGDSMNQGLALAQADWVGICEPDDFADVNMFEELYKPTQIFDVDVVKSGFYLHRDEVDARGRAATDRHIRLFDGFPNGRAICPADYPDLLRTRFVVSAALYRRQLIEDNEIFFTPSPGASFQDTSFVHRCWIAARSVYLMRRGFMHYRIDNATSSSNGQATDKVYAVCDEYARTFAFLEERGEEALHTFGPALDAARYAGYSWNYTRIAPELRPEFMQRWISELESAVEQGLSGFDLLHPEDQARYQLLMAGPDAFRAAFPGEVPLRSVAEAMRATSSALVD